MKGERGGRDVELEFDELAPVLQWLEIAVVALLAGVALAFALRRLNASWTWSPLVGGAAGAAAWLLGADAVPAAAALACSATVAASALSWRARSRGGVVRERERRRVGPLQLAAREVRATRRRGRRVRKARLALGQTDDRRLVEVPFGSARGCHGLILGATDSGKTVSAASIAQATIRAGNAVIAIDPKGDGDLEALLAREADAIGVPFWSWSPRGDAAYNIAGRGGPSEVADKVLSGHEWSEPHYLSVALRFVQREVEVLRACGVDVNLASIARYMHGERLEALADSNGGGVGERVEAISGDFSRRMLDDLGGARSRIALLAESEFGVWLRCGSEDVREIDLASVVASRGVAYFRLESDRYEQLGRLLAASLIVDLVTLSAELQGGSLRALVMIDEFAAVAADQVTRLFATARGAGLSTVLISQGMADIRSASSDAGHAQTLAAQVVQNVAYVLAHRQTDPEARELLAKIAGTYETWALAQQVEGEVLTHRSGPGSRFPTHEFRVHPNEFKALRQGEAVVIESGRRRSAQRVRVWRPQNLIA